MFSTTCWHLKSICVRAAEPLLTMSDTENIWRMPTRTSAMIVMARSTSTKLLPRARWARRSAILIHPGCGRIGPGIAAVDLTDGPHAPNRVDAEQEACRRSEGSVDDVHVRDDERGRSTDLPARRGGEAGFRGRGFRTDRHRAPLEVAHDDARHVPGRRVVRPERRFHQVRAVLRQAELLIHAGDPERAGKPLHDDVVLIDEEIGARDRRHLLKAVEDFVLRLVADQVDGKRTGGSRRHEGAHLHEYRDTPALHFRVRPLEENLDVPRGALELLSLPGFRDLASADDDGDADDHDDRHQLDQAEPSPAVRAERVRRWADE